MLVGGGDGSVRVYYDPEKSNNGAKLCVVRKPTKAKVTSYVATQHIITPYSLPLFKEDRQRSTKRQEEKARKDPKKSKRPDLPLGMKGEKISFIQILREIKFGRFSVYEQKIFFIFFHRQI